MSKYERGSLKSTHASFWLLMFDGDDDYGDVDDVYDDNNDDNDGEDDDDDDDDYDVWQNISYCMGYAYLVRPCKWNAQVYAHGFVLVYLCLIVKPRHMVSAQFFHG